MWFKLKWYLNKTNLSSNQEIIKQTVVDHPGLRFHEIKKETKLANGTLQHHLSKLSNSKSITTKYVEKVPRYYTNDVDAIQFSVNSGTFDGTIKLYGIKDS